jgi:hypothetical protein
MCGLAKILTSFFDQDTYIDSQHVCVQKHMAQSDRTLRFSVKVGAAFVPQVPCQQSARVARRRSQHASPLLSLRRDRQTV